MSFDQAAGILSELIGNSQDIQGVTVVSEQVQVADTEALKDLGTELIKQLGSGLGLLGAVIEDAPYLVCVVSDDIISKHKLKAGDIVRELGRELGGGGGGKPQMATAGGKDVSKLESVLKSVHKLVGDRLG